MRAKRGPGHQQQQGTGYRSQRFHLPMAIRMVGVWRPLRILDGTPHHRGTQHIQRRLDAVGDQSIRMTKKTPRNLCEGKDEVDQNARNQKLAAFLRPTTYGIHGIELLISEAQKLVKLILPAAGSKSPASVLLKYATVRSFSLGTGTDPGPTQPFGCSVIV